MIRGEELCSTFGVTYRQVDNWARRGWLGIRSRGSGVPRSWEPDHVLRVAVLAAVSRLLDAGRRRGGSEYPAALLDRLPVLTLADCDAPAAFGSLTASLVVDLPRLAAQTHAFLRDLRDRDGRGCGVTRDTVTGTVTTVDSEPRDEHGTEWPAFSVRALTAQFEDRIAQLEHDLGIG